MSAIPLMEMYTSTANADKTAKRVITFNGILAPKPAAWEGSQAWHDAFEIAKELGIKIQPAYGYAGNMDE